MDIFSFFFPSAAVGTKNGKKGGGGGERERGAPLTPLTEEEMFLLLF